MNHEFRKDMNHEFRKEFGKIVDFQRNDGSFEGWFWNFTSCGLNSEEFQMFSLNLNWPFLGKSQQKSP